MPRRSKSRKNKQNSSHTKNTKYTKMRGEPIEYYVPPGLPPVRKVEIASNVMFSLSSSGEGYCDLAAGSINSKRRSSGRALSLSSIKHSCTHEEGSQSKDQVESLVEEFNAKVVISC